MTEAEWLACKVPEQMFRHIQRLPASERQWRLFAIFCCRRIWDRLPDERCRTALEVCERYVEGLADVSELEGAQRGANAAFVEFDDRDGWETAASAVCSTCALKDVPLNAFSASQEAALLVWPRDRRRLEYRRQSNALRDIIGNPFRRQPFFPTWRTDTARALARQMYESRDFSAAPILADALQDAGCDYDDLLNHLRDTRETHVRGCWAVDLVLEKL